MSLQTDVRLISLKSLSFNKSKFFVDALEFKFQELVPFYVELMID